MAAMEVRGGLPDAELVRSARAGDRAAFELLVRRHLGAVYAQALREAPAEPDAEDVAQEAFVRAYGALSTLSDPAAFGGWVRRIAVNLARDAARARARHGEVGDPESPDLAGALAAPAGGPSSSQQVRAAESRRQILEAIAALPEEYAQVAAMRYVETLDYGEMSRRLGLGREALRKRLHRANLLLRRALRLTFPEYAAEDSA